MKQKNKLSEIDQLMNKNNQILKKPKLNMEDFRVLDKIDMNISKDKKKKGFG